MSLRDEMIEGIRQVLSSSLHNYLRNHDAVEDYSNETAPEIADVVFEIIGMDVYQQDLEY
jgi:hypothetical protein